MSEEPQICLSLLCEKDEHTGPCTDGVDRSEQMISTHTGLPENKTEEPKVDDPRIEPKYFLGQTTSPLAKWTEVSREVYHEVKRLARQRTNYNAHPGPGEWWETGFLGGIKVQFRDDPRLNLLPKEPTWVTEIRELAKTDPVKLQNRMDRIAEAHTAEGSTCPECLENTPCPTHVWATTDRDAIATWDPTDDEETQG